MRHFDWLEAPVMLEHGLSSANFRYCLRDKAAWVAPLAVTVRFPSSRFDEMVRSG